MRRPAVFVDRDGTLVHDEGYMSRPGQLRLIRNAANGLRRIAALGYVPVLVTNQSGVGRGLFTMADLDRMNRRLRKMLADRGVRLAAMYSCPHRPDDGCTCRKPRPGMLRRAARDLELDLRRSVVIGDSARDVEAGRTVGATTILVKTGEDRKAPADYVARDLLDAARWLAGIHRETRGTR